jgi:hypothetical protein
MATNPNATQITPPRVPIIDERTGAVSREWYRWFYSLYNLVGTGTGIIPVTSGGTGLDTIPTNGQLLIGNGTGYTLNTLGVGVGISVTNGLGTITLANTGVLSNIAGAGISVSGATGNVTIANTGVLSFSGGTTGLTPATATTGDVTLAGTLAIANGGTNTSATPTAYGVAYGTGTAYAFTAAGTAKQVLIANTSAAPTWSTLTSGTSILYGDGSGGFSNVTIGSGISFVAGTLSATGSGGTVTSVTGTSPVNVATGTTTPVISLAAAYGDTLNPYGTKTANYVLAGPTTGAAAVPTFRALVANDIPSLSYVTSVSFTGGIITVATPTTTPAFTVAGTSGGIPYFASGTTWASSAALTQYGVVYGGGAGAAPVSTAAGTTGQVLTATTGAAPTWAAPATSGTVTSVSVATANGFAGTVATATTTPAITLTTSVTGVLKGNGTAISAAVVNTDYFAPSAPVTKTADFTVAATDVWLINNKTGSTCTVTLPTASSWTGRVLRFLNYQTQTVVSASSNVVPLTGGSAATSILLASTGDQTTLVSDGSNWLMTQYVPNNILLLE